MTGLLWHTWWHAFQVNKSGIVPWMVWDWRGSISIVVPKKSNHNNVQESFKTLLSSIWAVQQFTWDALTLGLFDRNEGLPTHEFHGTMRKIANIHPNDSGPLLANGPSRDKNQNHVSFKYNQQNIYLPTSCFRTFLHLHSKKIQSHFDIFVLFGIYFSLFIVHLQDSSLKNLSGININIPVSCLGIVDEMMLALATGTLEAMRSKSVNQWCKHQTTKY